MTRLQLIQDMLADILVKEGWPTYSNRRADRGGPTKGGITLDTLSSWRGHPCTIAELKALTEIEARAIYRQRYIQPWEFIAYDRLFEVCVDYAVTSWHDDPTKALQTALDVRADGVMGPITRHAITAYRDPEGLRNRVVAYRVQHQTRIALTDPKLKALIKGRNDLQILNLMGWINRSVSFLTR